jgi:hypothetical protein
MQTATQDKVDKQQCAERNLRALTSDGDTIYTLTSYGRGETDYVRVFITFDGRIKDITGRTAMTLGRRLVNNDDRFGIAMGGYGYNKGHDVGMALKRALGRDVRWESL